jgi:histone H3/H4
VGALKEIRHYQKAETLLIPAAPFGRVVRDVALQLKPDLRFQRSAILALQESAESVLINELASKFTVSIYYISTNIVIIVANLAAIHAKRVTIQQKDMELIKNLRVMMTGCGILLYLLLIRGLLI